MKKQLILYKYRPDDINTIKVLCEQRLHFSHPCDFNDPMDCKPACSDFITEDMILSFVAEDHPQDVELVKNNMQNIIRDLNNKEELQPIVDNVFNALYICSMSYNADSPIMWSHYCNNHTGLCLGFDLKMGGSIIETGTLKKVHYVKKRQVFDPKNIETTQVVQILTEKFKQWIYEDEVRIIKTPEQMIINGVFQNAFDKNSLVAMFFGLRMSPERQNFYQRLCKLCGLNNVSFFKMTLPTDGSYYLIPKEI